MIVKANQAGLYARVKAQPWAQIPVVWDEPTEHRHGRDEQRSYKIATVARGLRFPYANRSSRSLANDASAVPQGGAPRWSTRSAPFPPRPHHHGC